MLDLEKLFLAHQIKFSCTANRVFHILPVSSKLILFVIFSLYKTKLVDPWVRQKGDQHVLQNTCCNGQTLSLSMTSQNDVEIRMPDANLQNISR